MNNYPTRDGGWVEVDMDTLRIYNSAGTEIVGWIQDEWEEDPGAAIAIFHAIGIALTKGATIVAQIIGKKL